MSAMTVMSNLRIHYNQIYGQLPDDALTFNEVITYLDISYNNLSGILPATSAASITTLRLDGNPLLFEGSLPPWAEATSSLILSSKGAFSCPMVIYSAASVLDHYAFIG
jgi:hypothetical protein